ncbi:MAG: GSCFA domain-containing protein [Bacteroidota bacterium]
MKKTELAPLNTDKYGYDARFAFLGSCFSEHLSNRLTNRAFDIFAQPHGVVFNPLSLAQLFFNDRSDWRASIFKREDIYLSWMAHSSLYAKSSEELEDLLVHRQHQFFQFLKNTDVLFVTFGTAWVYALEKNQEVVANCHKMPAHLFEKRCLSTAEITNLWEDVLRKCHAVHPRLKIVLTVSPVRHVKDGLINNNKSKAHLISAAHALADQHESIAYFPAYELIMDELRDYAYFERDGIHPNALAVDRVEAYFTQTYIDEKSRTILKEYEKIKKLQEHRPIHPEAERHARFLAQLEEQKKAFVEKYPHFSF